MSSRFPSPRSDATTTCFGSNPVRRPSVKAISISGTIAPRKLKIPSTYAGESGSFVTRGHSRTSSTSSTGRQNRSRPLRNTQYCDCGVRSTPGSSASSSSPSSASAGIGVKWNSSFMPLLFETPLCEAAHSSQKLFPRERLRHISVRALLLAPIAIARRILRRHQNHRNRIEFRIAFQLPANLKPIALRHHHVEQNHARALHGNGLFHPPRVVQAHGPVALGLQQSLDQLHLGRRVVDNQNFFLHTHSLRTVLHVGKLHVGGHLVGLLGGRARFFYLIEKEYVSGFGEAATDGESASNSLLPSQLAIASHPLSVRSPAMRISASPR